MVYHTQHKPYHIGGVDSRLGGNPVGKIGHRAASLYKCNHTARRFFLPWQPMAPSLEQIEGRHTAASDDNGNCTNRGF